MSSTTQLYNGTVTIHFNEKSRNRYVVAETGKSPVGVTTVLSTLNKPALMLWPLNEASKILSDSVGKVLTQDKLDEAKKAYLVKGDKGKDTGTEIHAMIESYLRGDSIVSGSPEAMLAFSAFENWWKPQDIKALSVERVVYSKEHNFAGTCDAILRINGETVLCDWKSTNASRSAPRGIYAEYFLQLGAYNLAYREEKATRVDFDPNKNYHQDYPTDLMVIRVGKDGIINTLRASEMGLSIRDCENGFLQVLKTYQMITPLAKSIGEMK